jgi:phosphoribosylformylglycinamidine synthase
MKSAVIVFPGSNCDRDMAVALRAFGGHDPAMVWHGESQLPDGLDLIAIPGGFSYGDYLRAGALSARSPIMRAVVAAAERGVYVLGACNGFQILTESGLLPGALLRNADLRFVCKTVGLAVVNRDTGFTRRISSDQITLPIAHHDGNYFASSEIVAQLEGEGRIIFRYLGGENPNGSLADIAGISNQRGNVLGMMPHPERAIDAIHPSRDGSGLFRSLLGC